MTAAQITVAFEGGARTTPAYGSLLWTPTARTVDGTTVVLPTPFVAALAVSPAVVSVPLSDGVTWCWRVQERVPGGTIRYVSVTADAAYSALIDVDPATLQPSAVPPAAWTVAVQNLQAGVDAVGAAVATVTGATASAAASAASAATSASLVGAPADTAMAGFLGNAASASRVGLDATYAASFGPRPYHLDAYANFITGPFVTGQGSIATTLTAQATAGAVTLAVNSGVSFPTNTIIVTDPGTAIQQQYKVTGGGGTTTLTVTPAVVTTLANGAAIAPLWTNSSHLTNYGGGDGFAAFTYWIVNAKKADGSRIITDPGTKPVVWFGDSWAAQSAAVFAAAIHALYPSATVTNAGVSGNGAAQMIARFATDVPTNAAYVIFNEPGVNDVINGVAPTVNATALETLISLIRGIGAVPIFTGMVPLFDAPAASLAASVALRAQLAFPALFPSIPQSSADGRYAIPAKTNTSNYGLGTDVQKAVTTADFSTAVGYKAQAALTTGQNNTAVGQTAQTALTTGSHNTAVGLTSQLGLTTGSLNTAVGAFTQGTVTNGGNNTAIGAYAQLLATHSGNTSVGFQAHRGLTLGDDNTAVGYGAGYTPGGVAANATTTASFQTCVGRESGQASATQANYITAVGYKALVTAAGGVALGSDNAGTGAVSVAVNEFTLGTALHTVKVPGRLNIARRTPTSGADAQGQVGDIVADDNYIYAKTSTGWKRSAITTW